MVLGCGTKKKAEQAKSEEPVNVEKNETTPQTMDVIKVKAAIDRPDRAIASDPFTIDAIEIRGNIMYADVTYSGGCEAHDFEVVGSPEIAKSLPPIRGVKILHYANGDSCREVKKVKLEIYINELAYQQEAGSEIYFTIQGWKEKVLYVFQK